MSFDVGLKSLDIAQLEQAFGRRDVRAYVDRSKAYSFVTTSAHVLVAAAYTKGSCDDDDRAWVAQHRVW